MLVLKAKSLEKLFRLSKAFIEGEKKVPGLFLLRIKIKPTEQFFFFDKEVTLS